MLLGGGVGGVGKALVVEVVQQAHQAPGLRIFARPLGHGTHGDLDGVHVLPEGIGGGVLVHQGQGAVAGPGHGGKGER